MIFACNGWIKIMEKTGAAECRFYFFFCFFTRCVSRFLYLFVMMYLQYKKVVHPNLCIQMNLTTESIGFNTGVLFTFSLAAIAVLLFLFTVYLTGRRFLIYFLSGLCFRLMLCFLLLVVPGLEVLRIVLCMTLFCLPVLFLLETVFAWIAVLR